MLGVPVRVPTERKQQSMRARISWIGVVSFVLWATIGADAIPSDQWTYHNEFHNAVSAADSIVVRDGGFNCCRSVDGQKVLFRVTDSNEIKEVARHIQFQSPQSMDSCMCCGYPGIDWYKGGKRIALTSIQHGMALRWKGFPGDANFTDDSAKWITTWLAKHGVTAPQQEFEAEKRWKTAEQEARAILGKYVPAGYLDAIKRAEAEASSAELGKDATMFDRLEKEDQLKDKYIRAAFQDANRMYFSLFRLMGCMTMRWDARYDPEQYEAYEFLTRAPREELDRAIRSAARSKDAAERQGAARMVFSQHYMTIYGKSEHDIAQWMVMLAEAAYADPLPENRRLVLHRLAKDYETQLLDIFERATADPDLTVRRKAMSAVAAYGGDRAIKVLRRIAAGDSQPRKAGILPTDYASGTEGSYYTEGMEEEAYADTDQEFARKAIALTPKRPKTKGR
jgi:hypothetical protein